jgi:hypothetical protein
VYRSPSDVRVHQQRRRGALQHRPDLSAAAGGSPRLRCLYHTLANQVSLGLGDRGKPGLIRLSTDRSMRLTVSVGARHKSLSLGRAQRGPVGRA